MPKEQKKVKIINPSLQQGDIIENRYSVESFKPINEYSGGDGVVRDTYDNRV